ncbi:bacterial Ig-like domain-containing protein [Lactococcus petauri]|uniref:MucBP domain-containing protein n=1 Tax=Lactococcus petauri TaxID=1940789 RepID=UPI00233085B1|nr:MucBP domain-containing protein [Lactococcus petauri]MDC0815745.1 bacterial Ig-like domain-containing protein [Lactococcus petauri]MDC0817736.1 bacterial Ig-like domain-containing protein [Lactococcus petauri]MDC0824232.1 bacterial Ig-like domain-containing protein [Lactococcus petauri]MDC0830705.1 bacterial Ig-like domain-containing protein [Lactococcus petauri]
MEEYDGSYPDTYVWEEKNNETLEVKDSLIYVGDNWKAEDNFVSATDKEGNTLSVSDVVIEGIVDTDNVGEYDITYKNGSLSKVAKVTVKKRKVTTRPDIIVGTVYENTQLNTNFYGYLGNIGTSFPERDTYPEFHTGSNREGFIVPNNLVTTYTLKNNTKFVELPTITLPQLFKSGSLGNEDILLDEGIVSYSLDGINFTTNPPMNPEEIKAIRFEWFKGGVVTYPKGRFIPEKITGKVVIDLSEVSGNEVVVMENNSTGTSVNGTIDSKITNYVVQTKENKTAINAHDSSIYVGDTWKAEDNFDSAVDKDGNKVDFKDITVDDSKVDTSKAGIYEVKYSYGGAESTATLTVINHPIQNSEVIVKYIDTDGNKILGNIVKTGNIGETYTTEQKAIEGYTFKEVQGKPSGQFTDQAQTVTYVYTKNEIPNLTGTVLVKYVDTDGNKISEDVVKSGTVGEDYSTEKKAIKGYTFKEIQGEAAGQFKDQPQTVTYVYTKDKNDTVKPESKLENKPDSKDKNDTQGITSSTQHGLPATGENERMTMMSLILGLVLLALGAVVSIFRFKKVNK